MDKRLTIFMVLSVALILVNQIIYLTFFAPPPKRAAPPAAVAEADADAAKPEADRPQRDPALPAPVAERPAQPAQPAQPVADRPEIAAERRVLGSADPASPYRMLVIFNNRGAAIERLELNGPRYRDLEDRSGYLGYLAAGDAAGRAGATVSVVGAGTPAAAAGLEPGDVITSVGKVSVFTADDLTKALAESVPAQSLPIAVVRGGQALQLTAELRRQPLAVIRPEWHSKPVASPDVNPCDPLSFLLTLQQLDDRILDDGDGELGGVDLRTATWEIAVADAEKVSFKCLLPKLGLEVVKTYRLKPLPAEAHGDPDYPAYNLLLDVSIANTGERAHSIAYRLDGPTGLPTEGSWYAIKVSRNWSAAGLRDVVVRFEGHPPEQVSPSQLADPDFKKNWANSPLDFIAVDAQYFSSALVPLKEKPSDVWFSSIRPRRVGAVPDNKAQRGLTNVSFRLDSVPVELKPGGPPMAHQFQLFAGPKRPQLLAQYGPPPATLGELVYYGWFGVVSRPLFAILHAFYALVGNYGLAIIMLTVLVRTCMFPVSRKQTQGAQKMAELQPEIKKLNEKYKNEPEKRVRAQQDLFRAHSYNPMGGCLLGVAQIPIFVGLYNSLRVDVELRQSPLISESIRWASNLVAPDMFWNWSKYVPEWFAQGVGAFALGPYLNLLPIATVALMIVSQKMTLPPPTDEQAALQQKMMQYMMVFIGVMFFKVATGLCVYLLASSVWSIAERKLLPKTRPAGQAPAATAVAAARGSSGNGAPASKKKQRGARD